MRSSSLNINVKGSALYTNSSFFSVSGAIVEYYIRGFCVSREKGGRNHLFTHSPIHLFTLLLFLLLPSVSFAAPQMADYCYLPPFVTDPNTPPNVMLVYEKGDNTLKRAYKGSSYDNDTTYEGFFDSSAYYTYDSAKGYFKKANCTPKADNSYNCFPGNLLNWAFTSNLDITREVFYGFGWPKASGSSGAGEVFTYKGCFIADSGGASASTCEGCSDIDAPSSGCQSPVSKGQWSDGPTTCPQPASVNIGGTNYSYAIQIRKASGNSPTKIDFIRVKVGGTAPSCEGKANACLVSAECYTPVSSGQVKVRFGKSCSKNSAKACTLDSDCYPTDTNGVCQWDNRSGILQEYADKDQDYTYDSDAPRFGLRRWALSAAGEGGDRNKDILCDKAGGETTCSSTSGNCTSTSKTTLLRGILNATSKEPETESGSAPLGDMMRRIVYYFKGIATETDYADKDNAYTQTAYCWASDPAKKCRKNFAFFVTTGADITDSSPLSETCPNNTDANSSAFSQNTCYAYTNDLSVEDGTQNISSYIVHMDFYGDTCNSDAQCNTDSGQYCDKAKGYCRSSVAKLQYAADKGGGQYVSVSDPTRLRSILEGVLLNILSTSASASTVATLTTQTRESSTLTQAYFYPKRQGTPLRWIGYLRLLWSDSGANLREDTKNPGWLDLKNDKILSFWYSETGCSGGPCYRAMLFNDTGGDLKIDSCYTPAGDNTIDNEAVKAIWNAQTVLKNRTTDDRVIKVGIGDTSGVVDSSTCSGPDVDNKYSGFCDFKTSSPDLMATFRPFWNISSYCSNNISRWCADTSDCNYCTANPNRSCSFNPDCNYCDRKTTLRCTNDGGCYLSDYGTCNTTTGKCTIYWCNDGSGTCDTLETPCGVSGICKEKDCLSDDECTKNYGPCVTDTCNTSGFTCNAECDTNCAESVIRFVRGYDRPTPSGSSFRIRHQCDDASDDTSCPTGKTCCPSGQTCDTTTGLCSGPDVRMTLKLGDIVYSTPRISPNSAVSGYDITYKDTTYSNWVNSKIKGNCTSNDDCTSPDTCQTVGSYKICGGGGCSTDADCPSGTCLSGTCAGDGYTSIVIVGANDGMVHAFKVSKIKDISPAKDNCYGDASCGDVGANEGSQVARFADRPHWAKTSDTGSEPDTSPPTDIGKEMWAYVPFNAVPFLNWYCSESYCHISMVDARFIVVDASIDYDKDGSVEAIETGRSDTTSRCDTPTGSCACPPLVDGKCTYPWRRLLIGAMGVGGKQITVGSNIWSSSIFVLDITNPASPTLLWERPLPDGTLTTSTPAVVRLGAGDANGTWYLVIGSGPTSVGTNTVSYKSSNANIYVFDLRTGTPSATLDVGVSGVAVGDMMAVDMDNDYQVDDVYFGTYGGTGSSPKGKLYRLRIRNGASYNTTPSAENWPISIVTVPGGGDGRPIYASPEIAQDTYRNRWLYVGTGLYLSGEHAKPRCSNNESLTCNSDDDCIAAAAGTCGRDEYVGAFKETEACWKGSGTCNEYNKFLNTTDISFTGAKATQIGCFCAGNLLQTYDCNPDTGTCSGSCGPDEDIVVLKVTDATISGSGVPPSCSALKDKAAIDCLSNLITNNYDGWFRIIKGQKSFSRPFIAGGLANYTTFEPKSTVCSLGGDTHLYSLHYTTGTAYVQPTIYLAAGTSGTVASRSLTINASVNLGTGVPPLGESLVALPLSGETYRVITQVSGGLPGTTMSATLPAKSGYILWLVK